MVLVGVDCSRVFTLYVMNPCVIEGHPLDLGVIAIVILKGCEQNVALIFRGCSFYVIDMRG